MAKFPALPLWTDALIGDTFHLTPAEFGAYLRLLIVEWRTPDCSLPNDDVFLGRSIGDPKNWHRLKVVVMGYFTLGEDGRYRQKRLLDERDSCSRYAARASAGGDAKALKRKHRDSAKAVLNGCLQPAPYSSPTPLSSSTEIAKAISTSKPPVGAFEAFWLQCPRKVGKGAARKAFVKAVGKTAPATLESGITRYAASRANEPEEFTLHPATWLNQERWLDEPKSNGHAPNGLKFKLSPEDQAIEDANIQRFKEQGLI